MSQRIAFVDRSVADHLSLIGALGANVDVVLLEPEQDGWQQIAAALAARSPGGAPAADASAKISAVDILGHGSPGSVRLGSSVLDAGTLPAYAATLAQIGTSLAPGADLLLYGCNLGADAAGQALIEQIAALTGANVAASSDVTGAAAAGGDWALEVVAGTVDTAELQALGYSGTLAAITGTGGPETLDGTMASDVITALEGNDTLHGLSGNDLLDGGSGADVMAGGTGDDVYRVDDAGDTAIEGGGGAVRISTAADGSEGNGVTFRPAALSADMHHVAFLSTSSNLVPDDTNAVQDIFIKDLQTGAVSVVTTAADGRQANGSSGFQTISADGRFVAFLSEATNLFAQDTNGAWDVFIKDLQTGSVTLVSTASDGTQANAHSEEPMISADGRYIVFSSRANNLVPGDTQDSSDIFLKDLQTGSLTLVSTDADGLRGNGNSYEPAISADGRFVAFATNSILVSGSNSGGHEEVFVKDLQTGAISRASSAADGSGGNSRSYDPVLSADGRFVAFNSNASNLVADDTNNANDVFIKDLQTGAITRVSTTSDGSQANGSSSGPSLSGDGRFVAFTSHASNLAANDGSGTSDVFIKDLQSGSIARVSTAGDGGNLDNASYEPVLSADGKFVVFGSEATNLVAGDSNNGTDLFMANNPLLESGGVDTVEASVSFTLGPELENLTLTGSGDISGTGNALANVITGNSGNNRLDGAGGDDTLIGGLGSDTYVLRQGVPGLLVSTDFAAGSGGDVLDIDDLVTRSSGLKGNPLDPALGYLRLQQQGSDTQLQWDLDGAAGGNEGWTSIITLRNVDGTAVVAENFHFSPVPPPEPDPMPLTLTGTEEADVLTGGPLNDVINGLGGDDTLTGKEGDDQIDGGEGNDTLSGGLGSNIIKGGAGDDRLVETGSSSFGGVVINQIDMGAGHDTVVISRGGERATETILTGEGNDSVQLSMDGSFQQPYTIDTGSGDDSVVLSGSPSGTISTGDGNDVIDTGRASAVSRQWTIDAGAGDDTIILGGLSRPFPTIASTTTGGLGRDTYVLDYSFGDNVRNTSTDFAAGAGGDVLDVNKLLVRFAQSGFTGGNPFDPALGFLRLVQQGADTLLERDVDGSAGPSTWGTVITLQNVVAAALTSDNFTPAFAPTGGADGQTVTGTTGDDVLAGGAGNDSIAGGAGNDTLDAGAGADTIAYTLGGAPGAPVDGFDTVNGGTGVDNVTVTGSGDSDALVIAATGTSITADSAGSTANAPLLSMTGVEDLVLDLGAGNDSVSIAGDFTETDLAPSTITISGGIGDDTLSAAGVTSAHRVVFHGDAGNDTLAGGAGDDLLDGGAGGDSLSGGPGADRLVADALDTLSGGSGLDTFVFGNDVDATPLTSAGGALVTDFAPGAGGDVIDLAPLQQASAALGLSGNLFITEAAGLRLVQTLAGTRLDWDRDGRSTGFDWQAVALLQGITAGSVTAANFSGGLVPIISNAAPTVSVPLADRSVASGSAFAFTVPSGTFSDADGDVLTYTATLAGGAALPAWLQFNATTAAFSGSPAVGDVGSLEVEVTATDPGGLAVSDVFALDVTAAPGTTVGTANADVMAGTNGQDSLYGLGGDDQLSGGAGNDELFGGDGHDRLDGGTGNDTMTGGLGDDTYVVNARGDAVVESADGGQDRVEASVDYTLGANVEDLVLTGGTNLDGTGNALGNVLTGNGGRNKLSGLAGNDTLDGGAGRDELVGGLGDDLYVVDDARDNVVERASEGVDTVQSSVREFTLSANVENLTLAGAAVTGEGNGLDNVITGNVSANGLFGGEGNDQLFGLGGTDLLFGGTGNDVLDGGAGNDGLTGGAGNDIFRFQAGFARDVVADFSRGSDKIQIDSALFASFAALQSGTANNARGNAVISHDAGNTIELVGVRAEQLVAGDFVFA